MFVRLESQPHREGGRKAMDPHEVESRAAESGIVKITRKAAMVAHTR